MKKVKTRFYNISNVVIWGLLALLGFSSSCNKTPNWSAEYGTPHAKYIVNGKVSAKADNTPIEKVRVIMSGDTAFSDSNGNYQVSGTTFPDSQTFQIDFKDMDSTAKVTYKELDTTVQFNDPKFVKGDGHWYAGETSQELDVELDKK